jgi:hypothetical protein
MQHCIPFQLRLFRGKPAASLRAVAVAALLLFAALPATAGDVSLRLDSTTAYVDEPIGAELIVENFQTCGAPTFPSSPELEVRGSGIPSESQSTTIINGRVSRRITRIYRFELTPRKVGTLVIPPVTIEVDGQTQSTRAQRLRVRASDVDEYLWAEISSTVERAYVGQHIPLTLRIYMKPIQFNGRIIEPRDVRNLFTATTLPVFGQFPTDQLRSGTTRAPGSGESLYVFEIDAMYVADRPGTLKFDDVSIGVVYPLELERDFFELRIRRSRTMRVTPRVFPIEIQPLPEADRPAGFTGAVGRFGLRVRAKPTRVRVGDPIELTIDVTGDPPLHSVPPPNLRANEALRRDFRVPDEQLAGEVSRNGEHKRFTQVIRPSHADVREIPPLEYVYFDPERGRFAIAVSDSIPLEVQPSASVDVQSIGVAPSAETPPPAIVALDGLHPNEDRIDRLTARTRAPSMTAAITAVAAPPAAFTLGWLAVGLMRARSSQPARLRRARAARVALEKLASIQAADTGAAAATATVLAEYLADRAAAPSARFLGASDDDLDAAGVPADLRPQYRALTASLEAAAFGGAAQSQDLTAAVADFIRRTEAAR